MAKSKSPDRLRAVEDLATDLAVTAGAGAGKTTVLVDRFVNIARTPGLGPDRILAITFTRKAAAEMKERVIRVFEGSGDVARRRMTEAAYISTIHGFSERILRENPFAARIDPAFGVLTAYDEALFVEESLATMYQREDLRAFARRLGQEYGGGWRVFSLVREVARLMREGSESARQERGLIDDPEALVKAALDRAADGVRRCEVEALEKLAALVPLLEGASFKSRKGMYELAMRYVAEARRCVERAAIAAAEDAGIWRETKFTGQIEESHREAIRPLLLHVKDSAARVAGFDASEQETLERELLPLKRAVYVAAKQIDEEYQKHKAQSGKLDFHDLQLRARDLLRDAPDVRDAYAERFRHILLDESQDTDDLQHELVSLLRREDNVLFMVGDPKQAIFEFRGANPDVFHRELNKLPKKDQLALPENFRSREEIVVFVNGLGMQLLPEQFATIDAQADYAKTSLDGPAITSILAIQNPDPTGRGHEPVADVRPREAAAVAEEIVRLLKAGTKVRDPHSREPKWVSLEPRHIAMLFRTRTAIPYFERALAERGVPYVTASGQGFYERAEVLDCMMALRAIEQPLDDLGIVAVLRSPMVGASDEQLWELRQLAGEKRPLYPQLKKHPSLAGFGMRWSNLRRALRGRPAAEVLDAVFAETGYLAAIAAAADGPVMLGNVAKVRRRLRDMGAVTAGVAYAELVRARMLMDKEPLAAVFGEADNVVVLTTIHNAKGLEWPIVCLPNLSGSPRGEKALFSARHGVLLLEALTSDGVKQHPESLVEIREEIKDRAEQEERRLFYVALTRARERLIVSATLSEKAIEKARDEKENSPERFASPLHFLVANTDETLVVEREGGHDCEAFRTDVRHVRCAVEARTMWEGGEPLSKTVTPTVVESVPADPPPIVALPLGVKVTELLTYRRCPQVYRFAHVLEIEENVARRAVVRGAAKTEVSSVELGTIVHGLLERADFRASDLKAEAQRLVASEDEGLRPRLEAMLLAVLDGEIGALVRGAKRFEREWPFARMIDGVLVEGVIDLAVQDADGAWTVIDYKSNDYSRSGRFEYLADYYTPQLELYALALAGAGLGEVRECMLVFLQGPRVHRWAFRAGECLTEPWARETIGHIGRRNYETEPGPKCEMCGYRKRKVCAVGREWRGPTAIPPNASIQSA